MLRGLNATNDGLIEQLIVDPNYRILPHGVIFTCIDMGGWVTATWRRSDYAQGETGYRRIRYAGKKLSAHRVIYRAHVGPLKPKLEVNHKDGNRGNNHPSNLELISHAENIAHSYRVLKRPISRGHSKITGTIAERIRQLAALGVERKNLAIRFDVSLTTVSDILAGRTWKEASGG